MKSYPPDRAGSALHVLDQDRGTGRRRHEEGHEKPHVDRHWLFSRYPMIVRSLGRARISVAQVHESRAQRPAHVTPSILLPAGA